MKTQLLSILLALIMISCGGNGNHKNLYSIDSQIVLNDNHSFFALSEIAEGVEILKLETCEDALIGQRSTVAFVDSLLLVYSHAPYGSTSGGLFVFDSRTGDFKYKIPGFMDRGPLGYNRSLSPLVVDKNTILLNRWTSFGLWDFTTGKLLDDDVPLGSGTGSVYFLNDTTVLVDRLWVDPGTPDKLEVVSTIDGSVVRGLGQVREIDQTVDGNSYRSRLWRLGDNLSYYSMVCDTIYGIDRATFEFYPRFVLNLGRKLFPDVKGGIFALGYMLAETICESDRYLFLTYLDENVDNTGRHLVCYDKKENRTMYVGSLSSEENHSGFNDDISPLSVPFFPQNITSDGMAYSVVQAVNVVAELGEARAAELGINEEDNPVVVIAKLKK